MTEESLTLITQNPSFSLYDKPNSSSQDAMISKVSIIVTFSHIKAEAAKFDLAVSMSTSTQGYHLKKIKKCNELDSLMIHTKLHRNRPTGSWKQDILSIYTIDGHGSYLGHNTSIMLINFHFLLPPKLHTKFC